MCSWLSLCPADPTMSPLPSGPPVEGSVSQCEELLGRCCLGMESQYCEPLLLPSFLAPLIQGQQARQLLRSSACASFLLPLHTRSQGRAVTFSFVFSRFFRPRRLWFGTISWILLWCSVMASSLGSPSNITFIFRYPTSSHAGSFNICCNLHTFQGCNQSKF